MLTRNKIILYNFLADTIFIIHFALVLSVIFSWLFPSLFYYFLVLWVLTFVSEILFGRCVLTNLEFDLRRKIDPTKKFEKSCIVHYTKIWFGLKPKAQVPKNTFIKRNSFKIILIVLLCVSIAYRTIFF